ncbi:MAG: hypothetical protein ACXV5L_08050 [Thermoanaerobaculia bacterium]
MTSQTQPELSAASIIPLIESGTYARDVLLTIARGFLPLPQEDLVAVLAYMMGSADTEVAALARTSLADIPSRIVVAFAGNERLPAQHLRYLLLVATDPVVLQALIRNRSVTDLDVADLARHAESGVQEVVVINQIRILREPRILDALLENPNLTPDVRRRALEVREEFFEKKVRIQEQQAADAAQREEDLSFEAIADLLERAQSEEEAAAEAPPPQLNELEAKDKNSRALWTQVQFMTVAEKVQLAFKGDKMMRMFLVRERNRLVAAAAIRNPRMNDNEVEQIAGMRNVDEEVLRAIGMKRDWVAKYPIAMALAKNPKSPVGVVLPLINRLSLRDLKGLKDDKGVSDVVRSMAKRLYSQRSPKS